MIDDLPDDPTQLTAESLTQLFRDGGLAPSNPEVEVERVTAEPLAEGSAFLGSLARLNITWANKDTALPNRFVAKLPTRDPGGRTVGKMLNVWVREAQFYARLAPSWLLPYQPVERISSATIMRFSCWTTCIRPLWVTSW